jgi:uncharacterized membrane protein YphA (DoxX/SURF4 family)
MSVKTKKILSWVLSALLAFGFIAAGGSKLAGVPVQLQNLHSWGYPERFRFPIGLGEIALGIGLLVPASRTLTLYAVFGWAAVAAITHVQAGQAAMLGPSLAFAVVAALDLLVWKPVERVTVS